MSTLIENSLEWFSDHWQTPVCGSSDASRLLQIKPNTLKTRVQRGQAQALRTPGQVRDTIEFTGRQLVYNLLHNVFIQYGYPFENLESGECEPINESCDDVKKDTLTHPYKGDVVIRLVSRDGKIIKHYYPKGDVMKTTGDPAVIIPIGTMVIRMAVDLYVRNKSDAIQSVVETNQHNPKPKSKS